MEFDKGIGSSDVEKWIEEEMGKLFLTIIVRTAEAKSLKGTRREKENIFFFKFY